MRALVTGLWLSLAAGLAADDVIGRVVEHARNHLDGAGPNSFERAAYTGNLSHLPIGVFDSGIGGLTVLEAILSLDEFDNRTLRPGADGIPDFADERFIYFGDQANMPYGNYPKEERTDFLRELILKDMLFLLGKRYSVDDLTRFDKPPVKAIVIACNTGTAYGIDDIRRAIGTWGLPVIVVGVVEAGARGVRDTPGVSDSGIAVMATAGTCASGVYPKMIGRKLGLAGRPVPPIVQQGGVQFAAAIEGDPAVKSGVTEEARSEIRQLLETYRLERPAVPLGSLVLGCTHYPLALGEINAALDEARRDPQYAELLAPEIRFVDPAKWAAAELMRELAIARLRIKPGQSPAIANHMFFMSAPNPRWEDIKLNPDGGLDHAYKYGREPGDLHREDTRNVPMMPENLPVASARLVENKLPLVWQSLASAAALGE